MLDQEIVNYNSLAEKVESFFAYYTKTNADAEIVDLLLDLESDK